MFSHSRKNYEPESGLEVAIPQGKEPLPSVTTYTASDNTIVPSAEKTTAQKAASQTVCGVSRKVVFITLVTAVALIIAAALAGGLGGYFSSRNANVSQSATTAAAPAATSTAGTAGIISILPSSSSSTTPSVKSTSATASSSASSSTSRAFPSSDCPGANGALYTASWTTKHNSDGDLNAGANGGFQFRKFCNTVVTNATPLGATSAVSFDQCIELCGSYNYLHNSTECVAVTFNRDGGGCIIGANKTSTSTSTTVDSAILMKQ